MTSPTSAADTFLGQDPVPFYVDGQWTTGKHGNTIEVLRPSTGKLLATDTIYPHPPRKDWDGAINTLAKLIEKHKKDIPAFRRFSGRDRTCRHLKSGVAQGLGRPSQVQGRNIGVRHDEGLSAFNTRDRDLTDAIQPSGLNMDRIISVVCIGH